MKYFTLQAIKQRTQEQAFRVMLNACLIDSSVFDPSDIISIYYVQAFKRIIKEEEVDGTIFDRIRFQLLLNAGIEKPILQDCRMWKKIKESYQFN
jgi:hypothetical protein